MGAKARPKDATVFHNLGVVFTELGRFEAAEEHFSTAAELLRVEGKGSDDTMYGLATALSEQRTAPKLMQAESVLCDLLERAMKKEEKGILACTGRMSCWPITCR